MFDNNFGKYGPIFIILRIFGNSVFQLQCLIAFCLKSGVYVYALLYLLKLPSCPHYPITMADERQNQTAAPWGL